MEAVKAGHRHHSHQEAGQYEPDGLLQLTKDGTIFGPQEKNNLLILSKVQLQALFDFKHNTDVKI